jgi:two-component system CheB/CheR fusion protein
LITNAVEANINSGERFDVEYPLRGFHDDKLRWVRANGNVTRDREGKPTYFTGVVHDITTHKEDDIRKTDFIAMASHELRTPLTSLQAYIQLLAKRAEKTDDAFVLAALNKATVQVKRMGVLINGFLDASSFEAGKSYLNKAPFEMAALLNEILADMRLTNTSHNFILASCANLAVNADRDKIGQVINNLFSNAIKYSPKESNIEISCKKTDGMLQIGVKDQGQGINAADQEKIFNRYFRIENEGTQHVSGFGLGLYLSAEIIHQHNGKVWVQSEPGKGATFYFSLPLLDHE